MSKKPTQSKGIDSIHYDEHIINMMNETEVCLNCGTPLKYLTKDKRRNRGYCSLSCYYQKPPKFAYAELTQGKSIKPLILDLLNSTNSVQVTAELLGMNKQNLYLYLKKHKIKSVTIWREEINHAREKTFKENNIDIESIKKRCAQAPHDFNHR